MINIAELLGVEEQEVFTFEGGDVEFKVENNTLKYFNYDLRWTVSDFSLNSITTRKVIKAPRFPKDGTKYYFVNRDGRVIVAIYININFMDFLHYKFGNFYLTENEVTQEDVDFWKEFYNDTRQVKTIQY